MTMLSMWWWLPLAVAAAAIVPIWLGANRLLSEAARVRATTGELARLRPLVAEVTSEISAIGSWRGVHDMGPR